MSVIRPTFDDELERVHVDTTLLELTFRDTIEELFEVGKPWSKYRSLHVDVTSLPSRTGKTEWRVQMPANQSKLYVAINELVVEATKVMQLFVDLGTLLPQEFTISIWLITQDEPSIIGSIDQ